MERERITSATVDSDGPEGVDEGQENLETQTEILEAGSIHAEFLCDSRCYAKGRRGKIAYLVVH